MKILIFGGCGFIGSHVVDFLHREASNKLFIFDDLSTGSLENIQHLITTKHNTRIHFELMDIARREDVRDAFARFQPDVAIVLAAQAAISTSWTEPGLDANVNIVGMLNVITKAREFQCGQIIFTSTSAVYREKPHDMLHQGKLKETDQCDPCSPYGISKLAAERYLRTLFPDSVVLRLGNVFGPRQVPIGENQVIPRMIRHFKFGDEFMIFGDGSQTRDYVYVEDAARAVGHAVNARGGTYNIGSGKKMTVNQVAAAVEAAYEVHGYKWEHRPEPDPRRDICLDVRRAWEHLDWRAETSFEEGVKKTTEWWNARAESVPVAIQHKIVNMETA